MTDSHRPILISVVQYAGELTSGTLAVNDVIAAAARLGADGVEIRPQFWRDRERELPQARETIAAHDLVVTYATMTTLFAADPTEARQLRQDIDDTQRLGATQLRVFQGPAPADDDAAGWAGGQETVDYAAARGVTLALENFVGSPGGTIAESVRTLGKLPALAVNFDTGNYPHHGEDVRDAIRAFGARAVSAHLKDQSGPPDWVSHPLGAGDMPLPEIMAALDALPQRLIYCFEFQGGGDPDARIAQSIAYLRGRG